jgi:glyoxylase-like metal-dependent hydrolase (beta-lactamase superfamily II)
VGDINSYLVFPPAGSESLTLIDTGVKSPESDEALRRGFKEYGLSLEQVDRILITHAHPDHFGQAKRIRDVSGATLYASAIESERMKTHWMPSARRDGGVVAWFRRWGVPDDVLFYDTGRADLAQRIQDPIDVDVIIAEGDTLELGEFTLEVLATPGHCEGHVVFYERDTQTLFSGDHLLTDISPVPLLSLPAHPGLQRDRSLVRFMESLAKAEALDCRITFPSHGDVIWDHRALIASYRLHHERRKLQIARILRESPRTPFELAAQLFPKHYRSQIYLVMSEVVGHLDLLIDEGLVRLEEDGAMERAHVAPGTKLPAVGD